MTVPLIGLTTYARNAESWFRLPAQYVDSVRRAGGLPVLMPPGERHLAQWLATLDGLVLTGGGDLGHASYGGTPHPTVYDVDPDRDADEIELARHLARSDLPGLCICRGMQVLNVALGGTLIPHLPDVVGDAVAHRTPDAQPTPHDVQVAPASRLARVLEATAVRPMSWHHQAVHDLAPDLEVVARAPDDTIEAVELGDRPHLLAVQWHPELTSAEDAAQQRLFDALVRAAAQRAATCRT